VNILLIIVISVIAGLFLGAPFWVWIGKLKARLETWETKEKAAITNREEEIKALFTGIHKLLLKAEDKAKADVGKAMMGATQWNKTYKEQKLSPNDQAGLDILAQAGFVRDPETGQMVHQESAVEAIPAELHL
jgi:hypothetical protein